MFEFPEIWAVVGRIVLAAMLAVSVFSMVAYQIEKRKLMKEIAAKSSLAASLAPTPAPSTWGAASSIFLGAADWSGFHQAEPVKGNYCRDCGQVLDSVRRQDGFDPDTGKPNYIYVKRCPDWSASRSHEAIPYCLNTKVEAPIPHAHSHPDPTDLHTDCPPCIDQMLTDRVIDDQQATKLYEAAGMAKAEPTGMVTIPSGQPLTIKGPIAFRNRSSTNP